MKRWTVLYPQKNKDASSGNTIEILLKNRGLKTKKEIDGFLDPKLEDITIDFVDIDAKEVKKTLKRISKAIDDKEQIVVYGDYDVDGITATAILWETLYAIGAIAMPYIPHRVEEGYGLSIRGIENIKSQIKDVKVIITVDNGIVANEAVDFANKNGIDVIITDHHTLSSDKIPNAFSIVHTVKMCGAGIAWILSQHIKNEITNTQINNREYLDLVTLATIADLVPLTGANRTLVKVGLEYLRKTNRIGLHELFKESGINPEEIGVYEIGHIIGPRLNAMGRLESAMDSLRLLCTKSKKRAEDLAQVLGQTNRGRQLLTQSSSMHAVESEKKNVRSKNKIIFVTEEYEEGIIGLVAGKLVETFYKPSIVVSKGEKISKASARSISGFNIIEFIRSSSHLLINAGGHPMAAGFTVETANIEKLREFLETKAEKDIADEQLVRELKIDCVLPMEFISQTLYNELQKLSPFGMGNPEPTFVSSGVEIDTMKVIGREGKHLKLVFKPQIEAVAFNMGERYNELKQAGKVDIVYTIDENEWNGRVKLQLKIKDINAHPIANF